MYLLNKIGIFNTHCLMSSFFAAATVPLLTQGVHNSLFSFKVVLKPDLSWVKIVVVFSGHKLLGLFVFWCRYMRLKESKYMKVMVGIMSRSDLSAGSVLVVWSA